MLSKVVSLCMYDFGVVNFLIRRFPVCSNTRIARTMATYTVVMVRHGESAWNAENRFCGWYDADLADSGVAEAKRAGEVRMYCIQRLVFSFLVGLTPKTSH